MFTLSLSINSIGPAINIPLFYLPLFEYLNYCSKMGLEYSSSLLDKKPMDTLISSEIYSDSYTDSWTTGSLP